MRQLRIYFLAIALVLMGSVSADAALSRYGVRASSILAYSGTSPELDFLTTNARQGSRAVIDDDGGSGSPTLQKLVRAVGGVSRTTSVPALSGFIWTKSGTREGPTTDQLGAGSVGGSIAWGFMDSWAISGGQFCNSVPSSICDLATREDDETVAPTLLSSKYDMHSWNFHGTGFVAEPYIEQTSKVNNFGNIQIILRGPLDPNGTVPALPLVGIGAVGLSVFAMGVSFLKKR